MSEVEFRSAGNSTFLVRGALSFDTVQEAWRDSLELVDGSASLVLDLGGVVRTDSAGLALMIEWIREARKRDTELRFRNIPEQLLAIARTSRLESLLPVV